MKRQNTRPKRSSRPTEKFDGEQVYKVNKHKPKKPYDSSQSTITTDLKPKPLKKSSTQSGASNPSKPQKDQSKGTLNNL
jgi:hypothetical protein